VLPEFTAYRLRRETRASMVAACLILNHHLMKFSKSNKLGKRVRIAPINFISKPDHRLADLATVLQATLTFRCLPVHPAVE
jgi:hypothetical protein